MVALDDSEATPEKPARAAGLFEGEGGITNTDDRLTLRVNGTDGGVIRRFEEIVNRGRVYGPGIRIRALSVRA
jgi:hypothetical protein